MTITEITPPARDAAIAEITRRGGETSITGRYRTETLAVTGTDERAGLALLHAAGYRMYSARHGAHWARISYLCGTDDNGPWAVRVPGTITGTAAALAWLTPAAVTAALARGRRIRRQGDLYAVETTAAHDTEISGPFGDSHHWNAATRYLTHRPADGRKHRPLHVPYPVRFVPQRAYEMPRTGRRGYGD